MSKFLICFNFLVVTFHALSDEPKYIVEPKGLGGITNLDRTFSEAKYIRMVRLKSGVKTAFPVVESKVNFDELIK